MSTNMTFFNTTIATDVHAPTYWTIDIVLYIIYVIQGSAMFLGNALVFFTIAFHAALHANKEFVLVAGTVFFSFWWLTSLSQDSPPSTLFKDLGSHQLEFGD